MASLESAKEVAKNTAEVAAKEVAKNTAEVAAKEVAKNTAEVAAKKGSMNHPLQAGSFPDIPFRD